MPAFRIPGISLVYLAALSSCGPCNRASPPPPPIAAAPVAANPNGPFSPRGGWIDLPPSQSGTDSDPYVLAVGNGRFAAAWYDSPSGALVSVFDGSGARVSGPTRFYEDGGKREFFSGGAFPDGSFVLAYRYYGGPANSGVRAQLFTPGGDKAGPEVRVEAGAEQFENAEVAVLSDGTFAVGWENRTAKTATVRRFGRDGSKVGNDFPLPEAGVVVRLAALAPSGLALAFQARDGGPTETRTLTNDLRVLSTASAQTGFSTVGSDQIRLAAFPNGEFAVVGRSRYSNTQERQEELRVMRFTSMNLPKRTTVVVTTAIENDYRSFNPAIAAVGDGFFVTWTDEHDVPSGRPPTSTVFGQLYDSKDAKVGERLTVFEPGADRPGALFGWAPAAHWNGVLYVAGYERSRYDAVLRRLAR